MSAPPTPHLLLLSAKGLPELEKMRARLAGHLREHRDLALPDIAFTLQEGRRELPYRCAVVATGIEQAIAGLGTPLPGDVRPAGAPPAVAFLLPGQGAQRPGMFGDLYRGEPGFRQHADRCAEALSAALGEDLARLVFDPSGVTEERLRRTELAQPALFLVEYALAGFLQDCGVRPSALLGHSIGEYTAACLSGVFDLDTCARIVVARARLLQRMPPGAMLAVPLSEKDLIERLPSGVEIAAVNGPRDCVLSGREEALTVFAGQLGEEGVRSARLRTSHAFHSAAMAPAADELRDLIAGHRLSPPRIPLLSNVTGDWLDERRATDPEYWASQLRQPVLFAQGAARLLSAESGRVAIEVGPGTALSALARLSAATRENVAGSIGGHHDLYEVLGRLWCAGVTVDWAPVRGADRPRRVSLPAYPFRRDRHWIDGRFTRSAEDLPVRQPLPEWFWRPEWRPADVLAATAERTTGAWLVLAPADAEGPARAAGIGAELATALSDVDTRVVVAVAGPEFRRVADDRYVLDPANLGHFRLLFDELGDRWALRRVVHCLNTGKPADDQARRMHAAFHSVLCTAQAILGRYGDEAPAFDVVSDRVHAVRDGDELCAERAALLGPVRVLPLEHEGFRCRAVDLPAGGLGGDGGRGLLAELAGGVEPVVALREGKRWTLSYRPIAESAVPAAARTRGCHLITGGLGGVGMAFARHWGGNLVITGRTPLDAPGASRQREAVTELRELGADVRYFAADVADGPALTRIVREAVREFGGIAGVVHCAGIAGAGLAIGKTAEDADAVLSPKVAGGRAVAAALSAAVQQPDFVLLCSSHNSILGRFGQVDYCAANAVLDALAAELATGSATRWMSVNWGVWAGAGMAVDTELPQQLHGWRQETLRYAIRQDDLPQLLTHLLTMKRSQVIVSTRDFSEAVARHAGDEADRFRHALGRLARSKPERVSRRAPVGDAAGPSGPVAARVIELWREVLGVEDIGPDDNFLDLGGHSLVATMLLARLRREFGCELSLRDFLETPTVAAIVDRVGSGTSPGAPTARPALVAVPRATVRVGPEQSEQSGGVLGLMFFSADAEDETASGSRYQSLLSAAVFADENAFSAVWLPERHFAAFGGLHPNPAVIAAAVAGRTSRVRLRAGSVISPLHDAIRIAEEWAVVDNLSGGRVDLSFGSGWHVDDFVLGPGRYEDRKEIVAADVDVVRRLWRGETVSRANGAGARTSIRTYPRPVQRELPVWLTGESRSTFEQAGRTGANVLTALMHQTPEDLAEHIDVYRKTRKDHGHDPDTGQVTLMQHTLVVPDLDAVRDRMTAAYTRYIATNFELQRRNAHGLSVDTGDVGADDARVLAERNLTALVERTGLIGDPVACAGRVARWRAIGVDEIACLIDFLPDPGLVEDGLPFLAELGRLVRDDR
ncbi:MupA/Atu3671 family FMN-dependent luciferase-like monooxygenase [Amycolatopsis sp. H20-H5]|uniref:MupA/Atu3671 family FMN-dependent luciferase-like monooxygenase n=1 Tax=Amycolatopsis sp. H20-H5 TaxID=3046309 RepID=UPI002DBC1B8D|nr:MupA/Atu3671 family FMN-dependent luciferase-like monooxygenase [Amycolatopsis sp. H20-H5]MEC3979007.1 MupA/Atu3671 family FMN-dependent luciferase-like monooxygenase [Amycolatopsis sp. H20-H5]